MIYLDTSVALAHLLAEDRRPSDDFWARPLISSRLLQYETWRRIHALDVAASHGSAAGRLLDRVTLVELAPDVLGRAREPFATPVRTLDALHLATLAFLLQEGVQVQLASYDRRMVDAARAEGMTLHGME